MSRVSIEYPLLDHTTKVTSVICIVKCLAVSKKKHMIFVCFVSCCFHNDFQLIICRHINSERAHCYRYSSPFYFGVDGATELLLTIRKRNNRRAIRNRKWPRGACKNVTPTVTHERIKKNYQQINKCACARSIFVLKKSVKMRKKNKWKKLHEIQWDIGHKW